MIARLMKATIALLVSICVLVRGLWLSIFVSLNSIGLLRLRAPPLPLDCLLPKGLSKYIPGSGTHYCNQMSVEQAPPRSGQVQRNWRLSVQTDANFAIFSCIFNVCRAIAHDFSNKSWREISVKILSMGQGLTFPL